jgi:hypothetical protein
MSSWEMVLPSVTSRAVDDRELLERLADHLEDHLAEMIDRLIDSYRVVEGYRRLDSPEHRASLEQVVEANERLFIDLLRGQRPAREQADRIADGAVWRLEQGVPLVQVLQSYRLWTVTTWQEVGGFLAGHGDVSWQQTVDLAGLIIQHTEFVSAIASDAYTTEERGIWIDIDTLRGPQWELLLSGSADATAVDELQACSFGDRGPLRMWLVAARADGGPRISRHAAVRELVRSWRAAVDGPAVVAVGGGVVALLAPADAGGDALSARLADSRALECVAVACGAPHQRLVDLLAEHAEVHHALELAVRLPPAARPLTWREAVIPAAASGADRLLNGWLDRIVDVLRAYEQGHATPLLETLRTFLEEDLSIQRCARRLYCHRNTVRYRLRRTQELTGLDPADDEARAILRLALARDLLRPVGKVTSSSRGS